MANAGFTITVDIKDCSRLDPWAAGLQQAMIKTLQDAFRQSIQTVKSNERVKTGNMRNQTTVSNTGSGATLTAAAGYSGYQNFGTRYMSGTHFMEAGLNAIINQIGSTLPKALEPK